MVDFDPKDTSLWTRLSQVEKDIHLLTFRMTQLEEQRLPTRVQEVESTIQDMEHSFKELRTITHQTNSMVNMIRSEVNADLNELKDTMTAQINSLDKTLTGMSNRVVGAVVATTGLLGVVVWVIDLFGGAEALTRFMGG